MTSVTYLVPFWWNHIKPQVNAHNYRAFPHINVPQLCLWNKRNLRAGPCCATSEAGGLGMEDKREKITHNYIIHDDDTLGRGKSDDGSYQNLGNIKAAAAWIRFHPPPFARRAFHFQRSLALSDGSNRSTNNILFCMFQSKVDTRCSIRTVLY